MHRRIQDYFEGEKQESLLFLGIGLVAMATAALGWWYFNTPVWQGLAIPLATIALIQLTVGASIFLRTDRQLKALIWQLEKEPRAFVEEEGQRMAQVNKNFRIYRTVELSLFLLGLILFFLGAMGGKGAFVMGLGAGLTLQTAIMLVLDLFAEWRGSLYEHQLKKYGDQL